MCVAIGGCFAVCVCERVWPRAWMLVHPSPELNVCPRLCVGCHTPQVANRDPGGRGDWEASVAESAQRRPLGEFLSKPSCATKQFVHMRLVNATVEAQQASASSASSPVIDVEGRVLNKQLPDILSSSDIYTVNPQLLFGMTAATDFLRRVPGVNIPRGGACMVVFFAVS